jgi:hypothetical protein
MWRVVEVKGTAEGRWVSGVHEGLTGSVFRPGARTGISMSLGGMLHLGRGTQVRFGRRRGRREGAILCIVVGVS